MFIGQFVYILACKWINPPITITQTVDFKGSWFKKRLYFRIDQMGPNIKLAVMAAEDQLFP